MQESDSRSAPPGYREETNPLPGDEEPNRFRFCILHKLSEWEIPISITVAVSLIAYWLILNYTGYSEFDGPVALKINSIYIVTASWVQSPHRFCAELPESALRDFLAYVNSLQPGQDNIKAVRKKLGIQDTTETSVSTSGMQIEKIRMHSTNSEQLSVMIREIAPTGILTANTIYYLQDAAGNALLEITLPNGEIKAKALFSPRSIGELYGDLESALAKRKDIETAASVKPVAENQ